MHFFSFWRNGLCYRFFNPRFNVSVLILIKMQLYINFTCMRKKMSKVEFFIEITNFIVAYNVHHFHISFVNAKQLSFKFKWHCEFD